MSAYIDISGASGASYRFYQVENAQPSTAHSGLYLYAREAEEGPPHVLYAAEAENLMTGASVRWGEAQREHGATAFYSRLHVASSARRAELADILAAATPVMNA